MARAAASAASARSIVPIGVAARSKRSSTLADPADVTEEDPTAPAPALAPAPGGVPGGADGVPVGGASNSSAEGASAGGGGCTPRRAVMSSTSCSASDWNGGRPAATTTRARARSGATRPSVDARGGWGAGRPATAAMDARARARRTASCFSLRAPGRATRRLDRLDERAGCAREPSRTAWCDARGSRSSEGACVGERARRSSGSRGRSRARISVRPRHLPNVFGGWESPRRETMRVHVMLTICGIFAGEFEPWIFLVTFSDVNHVSPVR